MLLCFVILLASSFNMSLYFSGENNVFTVYIKQTRHKRERNVIWSDEKQNGLALAIKCDPILLRYN